MIRLVTINKLLVQEYRSSFNNGGCYNQSSRGTRKARYLPILKDSQRRDASLQKYIKKSLKCFF